MHPPANRAPFLLIVIAVLVIALVVLLSLSFWGLTLQFGHSVDYDRFGNWSDAISGLGSLLAVIAAAIAIVRDRQTALREEHAERQRRETDVHHWLDYV
jgi:heme exporter protein D